MTDIDKHAADVIRFETGQICAHVRDAVRKAQEEAYRMGQRSSAPSPVPAPDREALGRAVYEGVFGVSGLYQSWENVGCVTREMCCAAAVRIYAMGRASRDSEVAELWKTIDAHVAAW